MNSAVFCPTAWDGFNCWEPTLSGKTAYKPCPMVKGSDPHCTYNRFCQNKFSEFLISKTQNIINTVSSLL